METTSRKAIVAGVTVSELKRQKALEDENLCLKPAPGGWPTRPSISAPSRNCSHPPEADYLAGVSGHRSGHVSGRTPRDGGPGGRTLRRVVDVSWGKVKALSIL